jgi:hypothetical protein
MAEEVVLVGELQGQSESQYKVHIGLKSPLWLDKDKVKLNHLPTPAILAIVGLLPVTVTADVECIEGAIRDGGQQ